MRAQAGFTLLEILIALAIFTVVGIASTAVLSTVLDQDELSSERFDKLQQLQRAMMIIERDILQAIPRATRIEGESNERVMSGGRDLFASEADGFGLVRAGWHNPQLLLPRSTLQPVAYRLSEGQLQRLYGNYVDNVIGYESKMRVLLTDVEDFQVEFMISTGKDPRDSDSWEDSYTGTRLPRAMAVTLTTKDFGEIRREFLLSSEAASGT